MDMTAGMKKSDEMLEKMLKTGIDRNSAEALLGLAACIGMTSLFAQAFTPAESMKMIEEDLVKAAEKIVRASLSNVRMYTQSEVDALVKEEKKATAQAIIDDVLGDLHDTADFYGVKIEDDCDCEDEAIDITPIKPIFEPSMFGLSVAPPKPFFDVATYNGPVDCGNPNCLICQPIRNK